MSKKVGPLSFETAQPGEMSFDKPYSEHTSQLIDQEVRDMVNDAYERTIMLLSEKRDCIEKVRKNACIFQKFLISRLLNVYLRRKCFHDKT